MNTRIEDLIRQAQAQQAERAAAPDRIRGALPARAARVARRRRHGTLVAAVGAAAVAVAITVPVVALRDSAGGGISPAAPPTASADRVPTAVPVIPVTSLRYRPTWLPAGLAERNRMASFPARDGQFHGALRSWTRNPVGLVGEPKGGRLELQVSEAPPVGKPVEDAGGKPVDVNGVRGYYHGADGKSYVTWPAEAGIQLSISQHGLALSERDLLRVARSVRPDPAQLSSPLRFGSLPNGLAMSMLEVFGDSPTSWLARVSGEQMLGTPAGELAIPVKPGAAGVGEGAGARAKPAGPPTTTATAAVPPAPGGAKATQLPPGKSKENSQVRHLSVAVGTSTTAPDGGDSLVVSGHPARFVTRGVAEKLTLNYLVVDLGEGRLLTLLGEQVSRDDLVSTAEQVDVDPNPDLSWLGR